MKLIQPKRLNTAQSVEISDFGQMPMQFNMQKVVVARALKVAGMLASKVEITIDIHTLLTTYI